MAPDGQELLLAEDFEKEAETLRDSEVFRKFLDSRSQSTHRTRLEEIEAEIESELARRAETR